MLGWLQTARQAHMHLFRPRVEKKICPLFRALQASLFTHAGEPYLVDRGDVGVS